MAGDSDTARAPWELFVRRCFWWKLIHDPKFESSRNRAKRGLDIMAEPDEVEFAADVPRDPKSVTPVLTTSFPAHLFWTSVPCVKSH